MVNININVNKLLVSAAFLCSILSAAMASLELNSLFIILFLISITIGFIVELKHLATIPRIIINVCSLALFVAILSQFRYSYIIDPFMKLVIAMTAVKMLEKKSARDYLQLLILSLMMLICYAMVSIDKRFILYCFGVGMIWLFIMTLSAWQTKDPHAVISLKNLLQLFSRLFLMFLLMIPFCLVMFVIAPRLRSPFLVARGSSLGISNVGFSDQVVLGEASEIQRNNKLAFRAEVPRQPFSPYWRGVVLDLFDGRAWRASQNSARLTYVFADENLLNVKQEIYLEPGRRRYLFALDIPVSISKVQANVIGNGVIIYTGRNDGRRLQYTATSVPSNIMPMENADFNRRRYLSLPADFIPELENEVERIAGELDQSQIISAILDYLSPPDFEYSLTGMPDTPDALKQFIFESKKGSCEFFASAMGVMLRMAGIPSRLVGGYKGGIYNDTGGYYSVFEENAHVWVELWDEENSSWIRYDPTPPSLTGSSILENYGVLEAYLDLLDYHWTKFVLNYNLEIQGEVISSVKSIISNPGEAFELDGFLKHLPIASGIVALIVIGIYFLHKIIIRNKSEVLLHNFILAMKRKGFNKHKSEGLREFSDRLPEHEKIKAMPFIERFEEYYYKEKEFDKTTVEILKENLSILNSS